ncbi:hypothetical protein JA9_001394 [Meyerozyma sp. JA9]|nr:hypothetical protein JA9_001394 [Meyerozyma sp. JA9]
MGPKETKKITRSRKGCHNCKRLKIKCDEVKPKCSNCAKSKATCDYSLKLTWGGRPIKSEKKKAAGKTDAQFQIHNFRPTKDQHLESSQNYVGSPQFESGTDSSTSVRDFGNTPKDRYDPFRIMDYRSPVESSPFTTYSPQESATRDTIQPHISPPRPTKQRKIKKETSEMSPFFPATGDDNLFKQFDETTLQPNVADSGQALSDHNNMYQDMQTTDSITSQVSDFPMSISSSFVESLPEISNGVEVLSNALNRISGRSHQFNIRHSSMLNNYIQNFEERSPTPGISDTDPTDSGINNTEQIEAYDFNSYSQDLAKIEAYIPKSPSNFTSDFSGELRSILRGGTRKRSYDESEVKIEELDTSSYPSFEDESGSESLSLAHVLTPAEVFAQVPPPLTPFPELLLQVPFYRSLMHFWVHFASSHLVPAPSHVYLDNPFKVILPQMAMEYPAILTTLLAFSASAKVSLTGIRDVPQVIIDQLLARSCNELLKSLKDKKEATSDGTLATVLMLSSYEAFNSINFERSRAHTVGARQIVKARRLILPRVDDGSSPESDKGADSPGSSGALESDIAYFLMRWFVYLDVIGALSATKNSHNYLTTRNYMNDRTKPAEEAEEDPHYVPSDPKRDIDHLLGFDVKFLPLFSDVVLLIRETESYVQEHGGDCLPISIITRASELRDKTLRTYEVGERRRDVTIDIIKDNDDDKRHKRHPKTIKKLIDQHLILRCTNRLFCEMALLNLYRRALLIPRNSSIIQKLTKSIATILDEDIEPRSTAETCSIFCFFSAACDTLDQEARDMFERRFTNMAKTGNTNAAKSLQIMKRCWETGDTWMQASKDLDIDLTLL